MYNSQSCWHQVEMFIMLQTIYHNINLQNLVSCFDTDLILPSAYHFFIYVQVLHALATLEKRNL